MLVTVRFQSSRNPDASNIEAARIVIVDASASQRERQVIQPAPQLVNNKSSAGAKRRRARSVAEEILRHRAMDLGHPAGIARTSTEQFENRHNTAART